MTTISSQLLQEPLERLPGYVNTVLIQIGKVFRENAPRDARPVILGKSSVHQVISKANSQFHEALDEIEIDLTLQCVEAMLECKYELSACKLLHGCISVNIKSVLKAKAAMERDLAFLQARRAEREKAAGALRLRAASEERASTLPSVSITKTVAIDSKHVALDLPSMPNTEDTVMAEGFTAPIASMIAKPAPTPEPETAQPAPPMDTQPDSNTSQPLTSTASPNTLPKTQTSDFPTETHLSDADFDSMFADPTAPPTTDSLDFGDLDFSTTDAAQDSLTNELFDLTSTENIDSLMPGIENYVNAHTAGGSTTENSGGGGANLNDFAMLDLPAVGAFDGVGEQKASGFEGNGELLEGGGDAAAMGESNFDDLFFDEGGMEDGNMGDMGEGGFGEWNDKWFANDEQ